MFPADTADSRRKALLKITLNLRVLRYLPAGKAGLREEVFMYK